MRPLCTRSGQRSFALGLCLLAAAVASPSSAEEVPEVFTPVRPIGMGGAFTAVANDESAIWTNPAGIGRARKARSRATFNLLRVPNIFGGANSTSRNFFKTYSNSTEENVASIDADQLESKPLWVRAGLFPVTSFDLNRQTPVALGLYSNTTLKAVVDNATSDARVEAISDNSAILTYGYTNQSNRFNIGLSVRPTTRYAYEDRLSVDELRDQSILRSRAKDKANKMSGVGIDFGTMMTLADFWFPTVGIAIFNLPTGCKKDYLNPFSEKREVVCGNVYSGDIPNPDALSTIDPTDVRVGASIMPRLTNKIAVRLALDAHHLPLTIGSQHYGLTEIEVTKLIHAGAELHVGNPLEISPFSLRTGYSQGFFTAGASVNLGWLIVDVATFGRDISSTSRPVEDRRYLAQFSVGL